MFLFIQKKSVICKTVEIIFNSFQQILIVLKKILNFKSILEINHSPFNNMNGWDTLYICNMIHILSLKKRIIFTQVP